MEILFTVILLIVPVFSVVAFAVSLIAIKQVKAMRSLTLSLVSMMRGDAVTELDRAMDKFQLGGA